MSRRYYRRSRTVRKQALERDEYVCQRCGEDERLEVHHRVPLHRGGADILTNTITLCAHCHKQVTDKMQSKRGTVNPLTGLRML